MSKSAPLSQKKRKLEDGMKGKISRPKKRIRKQAKYHSSSEDEDASDDGFAPVNLVDSDEESVPAKSVLKSQPTKKAKPQKAESKASDDESQTASEIENEDASGPEDIDDDTNQGTRRKRSKRNDPEAFSTSISKILSTKLSQSVRKDPLLSRSRDAVETSRDIANERLERRARAKLRADKKDDLQKGRIKDVAGVTSGQAGEVAEEEKRLRKTAQRGVVKLFNAVRAAQVRAEQALREERKKGTVGHANREEKATEMSKQGFLELISGKKSEAIETA